MDEDSYVYEPRDKSGPMDIDSSYDTTRLDAFNLVGMADDGPARKRLHSELDRAVPFHPYPQAGFAHFNSANQNSAPLLLAALNTPRKAPAYDPSQWYNSNAPAPRTPGGMGGGAGVGSSSYSMQDVEMDSPARNLGPANTPKGGDQDAPASRKGKEASVVDEDTEEKENRTQSAAQASASEDGKADKEQPRKFAKGAVTRTNKKRERARKEKESAKIDGENTDVALRHSNSAAPTWSKSEHHYNVHMTPPALRHSEIPALLLGYLQFIVNASIVLFCLYLGVLLVMTVQRDVKDKMREYSVEILQEIAECTNLYLTNRCDPTFRVPAMEAPCKAWEACMNKDPTTIGRINIVAETFAGVINSFVEPISWKTMSFTLVTLSFLIILTNSALFNLRAKASHPDPATLQSHQPANGFWPPQSHFMPQLPPHMPHPQAHMLESTHHLPHQTPYKGVGGGDETRQIGWQGEEKKKGWW
ncbi:nuclear membrane protein [Kwoniella heveanensis BCC8398]|uniref:Nuclear membrane protein n=1 Tax=Kwoniella heveanensis BCC8398 TaxID=1296120 RepID=A0A1B9GW28_9TREE|nr:nuclear membrane protein [Kwoniella heveanensis BCC8398]